MKQFLMVRTEDDEILGTMMQPDTDVGPQTKPASPVPDGIYLVPYNGEFSRAAYLDTYKAQLVDGAVEWVDTQALSAGIASALAQSKADVNLVTAAAIGNLVNEYTQAAIDARAFAAAGYTGPTTSYVSSYAQDNETNIEQTNEWAAKAIIARADAFESAQESMRAKRFNFQRAMRNSTTPGELANVVYLWDQYILQLRMQLGL